MPLAAPGKPGLRDHLLFRDHASGSQVSTPDLRPWQRCRDVRPEPATATGWVKSYRFAGIVLLPFAACVGSIGSSPGADSDPSPIKAGPIPAGVEPAGSDCRESPPPVQAARRMTRDQYLATVRDLLGETRDL